MNKFKLDSTQKETSQVFGVSKERTDILGEIIQNSLNSEEDSPTDTFQKTIDSCETESELAFMMLSLGSYYEESRKKDPMSELMRMIGKEE